ncbi:lysophospholipid acyltransferase family protein [Sphingomonas sp. HDW15A]|uniref:lysophospholipid acyltransferase family protein n=1 Tax=Sphingomonas sp. HDW15A TaxID=2714942 RepID=UPI0032170A0B
MALIRSILFNLLFFPGTAIHCFGVLAVSPMGSGPVQAIVHSWSRMHYWLLRHVMGISFEWEGKLPAGPYLIAVKHESMVEAIDTLRFADTPVVVLKRELADIPVFGRVTRRYGVIPVDRDAGATALRQMMSLAKQAVVDRRPVIIFPEGTRVPRGARPQLRPGFAGLYRMLGLPVVPIAVDSGRVWPRGFVKRSGTIHFRVGEIIPPGLKREEVEARVHAAINALNLPTT